MSNAYVDFELFVVMYLRCSWILLFRCYYSGRHTHYHTRGILIYIWHLMDICSVCF